MAEQSVQYAVFNQMEYCDIFAKQIVKYLKRHPAGMEIAVLETTQI
jgi:hypothetical protein